MIVNYDYKIVEPIRVLGALPPTIETAEDHQRVLSTIREREGENEMLKAKIIEIEKRAVGN